MHHVVRYIDNAHLRNCETAFEFEGSPTRGSVPALNLLLSDRIFDVSTVYIAPRQRRPAVAILDEKTQEKSSGKMEMMEQT